MIPNSPLPHATSSHSLTESVAPISSSRPENARTETVIQRILADRKPLAHELARRSAESSGSTSTMAIQAEAPTLQDVAESRKATKRHTRSARGQEGVRAFLEASEWPPQERERTTTLISRSYPSDLAQLAMVRSLGIAGARQRQYILLSAHSIYVGEINKAGQPHGRGKEHRIDGSLCYEGSFENTTPHGQGKLFYPDGKIFEGEFQKGQPHGLGKVYRPDGTLEYEGQCRCSQSHGEGIRYHPDGRSVSYKGLYKDGEQHGPGKQYRLDGTLEYEGDYQNSKPHGQGRLYQRDGITLVYEGQVQNGKACGQGKLYHPDGTLCYESLFLAGNPQYQAEATTGLSPTSTSAS